jgi:hypothetical protein
VQLAGKKMKKHLATLKELNLPNVLQFNSFRVAKPFLLVLVPQSGMAQKALTFGGYSRFKPFGLDEV